MFILLKCNVHHVGTYCICNVSDGTIGAAVHDVGISFGGGYTGMASRFFHGSYIFTDICTHTDKRMSQVVYSHMWQLGI